MQWHEGDRTNLRHDLADVSKVRASTDPTSCQEVFDKPGADIISHLLELLVDLCVVLVVLD